MGAPIYLDNNATTPLDPRVLEFMLPYFSQKYGNAASHYHSFGWEAKKAVEHARKIIALELNAKVREIIFTSGATESINLAIKGICDGWTKKGRHIITQNTEHKAVLDTCKNLEERGWEITYLPVDRDGRLNPRLVLKAIRADTAIVVVMQANNEIGVLQPIREIGRICREKEVLFMVDAAQSFGKLPIDVQDFGIDLLAATAHKLYGPKGVGILYIRQKNPKVKVVSQIDGGGHERGFRSGTLPVPLIAGFGKAVELCAQVRGQENERMRTLRDQLIDGILAEHPDTVINGSREYRLTNNINVCFPGIAGESLIMKLKKIACSTGSACTSTSMVASHVIKALGLGEEAAHSALRFSIGRFTTEKDISLSVDYINDVVSKLKARLPSLQLTRAIE